MNQVLTEHYAKHLESVPGMYAGSRDSSLVPEVVRAVGAWAVDGDILNFLVSTNLSTKFLANIRDNKEVTFVAANVMGYETFQYKGKYISDSPADESDNNIHNQYAKGFGELVAQIGIDADRYTKSHSIPPFTRVTFKVSEIFDQSPKIKAGEQVSGIQNKREDSTPILMK